LLEHLAAAVEHEVVVRRHQGEDDGQGGAEAVLGQKTVLVPGKTRLLRQLAKHESIPEIATIPPEVATRARNAGKGNWVVRCWVVRKDNLRRLGNLPVANDIARAEVARRHPQTAPGVVRPREHIVFTSACHKAYRANELAEARIRVLLNQLLQLRRATAADTPGVFVQRRSRQFGDTDEGALRAGLVDLPHDGRPHERLRRIFGCAGLAADAHHGADGAGDGLAVAAEEDDSGRAVSGDIRTGGVHYVGEIPARDELLDELLAELPLHERVGGDLPNEAGRVGWAPAFAGATE
jgi:hypothetical protein